MFDNNNEFKQGKIEDKNETPINDKNNSGSFLNEKPIEAVKNKSENNQNCDGEKNSVTENKKSKIRGRITKVTLVAASSALVVYAVYSYVSNKTDVTCSFNSLVMSATTMVYDATLTNPSNKNNLTIKISNDFSEYSNAISLSDYSGSFSGLKENMYYTLEVLDGNIVVSSQRVKTNSEKETRFCIDELYYECTCYKDDLFHYKLAVVDDFSYWSNYAVTLSDSSGHIVNEKLTNSNVNSPQSIGIDSNNIEGSVATFSVSCDSTDPNDTLGKLSVNKVLYTDNNVVI